MAEWWSQQNHRPLAASSASLLSLASLLLFSAPWALPYLAVLSTTRPGTAGKAYTDTSKTPVRAGDGGGGQRPKATSTAPDPGLCLLPEKVSTGCYLRQPQRISTRTSSSTRWTQGRGTQISTQTV